MGRGPTNENTNMYFQARKKAATYNERLWSREGAAELPLATEEKSLEGIALRLLQSFNEDSLKDMRDNLIEITADGKITEDELPSLKKIIDQLEKMAEVISEMKIAGEKYMNGK